MKHGQKNIKLCHLYLYCYYFCLQWQSWGFCSRV